MLLVNIEVESVDVEEDQEVPVPEPKQRPKIQPPSLQRLEQDSALSPELSGTEVSLTI
jgi:hypothetical protein